MGRLIGIARAVKKRARLAELEETDVRLADGIIGDVRGATRDRQVTVLFREGWNAACDALGVQLPWVTRRANLLVEGVPVPNESERLAIGDLILEVTGETKPCSVMEAAHRGLRRAMAPQWRGGVCCRVVSGGHIHIGDFVEIV
ncbi:MAG TPA: MOSC domain-containing protein [Micropepsaceae bacterium]|jgi:MOSC domain-containing protein YiiM